MANGGSVVVRELLVKLGIRADTGRVAQFDAAIEKLKTSVSGLLTFLAKAAAAAAVFTGALIANTVAVSKNAQEIANQAELLGLTVEAYQEFQFALSATGVKAKDR